MHFSKISLDPSLESLKLAAKNKAGSTVGSVFSVGLTAAVALYPLKKTKRRCTRPRSEYRMRKKLGVAITAAGPCSPSRHANNLCRVHVQSSAARMAVNESAVSLWIILAVTVGAVMGLWIMIIRAIRARDRSVCRGIQ